MVLEALTQSDACSAGQRQPARRAAAECEAIEGRSQVDWDRRQPLSRTTEFLNAPYLFDHLRLEWNGKEWNGKEWNGIICMCVM